MESNERLVKLIQEGKTEYKEQLWNQCVDFVKYMANKYLLNFPEHYRQLFDDMINQAYLYFDTTVKNHDPEKGKFLTYYEFHIRNAFAEVLQNRTKKQKNDPLNTAVSFDVPINDAEDLTLAEMIIDVQSEEYLRSVEEVDFWRSVRSILQAAINRTVDIEFRDFFFTMLDYGTGVTKTMELLNIDRSLYAIYKNSYDRNVVRMKRYITNEAAKNRKQNSALSDMISYRTGLSNWRNNGFTSSVELDVLRRNNRVVTAESVTKMYNQATLN